MLPVEILPSDIFLYTSLWTFLCQGTKAIHNSKFAKQEKTHTEN